jgi:hypothetical protein
VRWLALALAALALTGCETTQEKSRKIEIRKRAEAKAPIAKGLEIAKPSRSISVNSAVAFHSTEGSAAAVILRNHGAAQREVPLLISVAQNGAPPATNGEPGIGRSLTSATFVPAHGTAVWVDDQLTLSGTPGKVTVTVGEGKPARGAVPKIEIVSHRIEKEGSSETITGTVANHSAVSQHELAVYALATRGGRTVAAGRGVVNLLAAGASSKFQIFLDGAPTSGAKLTLLAPPSTFR